MSDAVLISAPGDTAYTVADAPTALPGVRNGPAILRDPLAFLSSLPRYGDFVRIRVGRWEAYVACNPSLVLALLRNEPVFDKGGVMIEKIADFIGNGLPACPYSEHRRRRRAMQPAFDQEHLREYAQVMSRHVDRTTSGWRDGDTVLPYREAFDISSGIAAETLFGSTLDPTTVTELQQAIERLVGLGYRQLLMPAALQKLPTPQNRRYAAAKRYLWTTVRRILDDHRTGQSTSSSLLTRITTSADGTAGSAALSRDETFDEVLGLLPASVETTADAVAWAMLELAQHPNLQKRLAAECREVLADRPAGWEDLPRLDLAGRVVHEVLRMYAPAWMLTREVRTDIVVGGRTVPAGTNVFYSPYLLHRRADLFPSPDTFDPDRWLDPATPRRPGEGYIPFGAGARQCIGNDYALTETTLAVATMAARWTFELPSRPIAALRPQPQLTLVPPAVEVRLRRRGGGGR
ncbi:cytochrome P450 [Streptomyces cavernae]|uniref:cytochrome P450 n=1 Tax=Streptomyces cavernae TaxID=2259034 RepID=UPI000FEBFC52|nr:cytochrome P450 [Streptomyces cavernae]